MKTKYFLILAALGILSCSNSVEKTSIRIVMDRNTTKNDLAGMIEGLKSINVGLKVDETAFNEKGGLEKIKGKVEFPSYATASFNSENLGRIIIEHDLDMKEGGFSVKVKKRWF